MALLTPFINAAPNGAVLLGVANFARALMEGDRASFKAGYSAENAYIAAVEQARREGLDLDEVALGGCLGLDRGTALALLGAVRA